MSVCAHHTSRAWGAPPPASHLLLGGTGFFSLVRPVRGFPSEKPGRPASARLGAPVPAPQRRSAPVLLLFGAGAGHAASLTLPGLFPSGPAGRCTLFVLCSGCSSFTPLSPPTLAFLPPPTSRLCMWKENLFIPISLQKQIVPGGGGWEGGLDAPFPAARHCFPTPRVLYVNTHTHTHTRVRAGCFESHTCTHTHTRTCARRLLESPDARGSPAGLSHLPAWSSGSRCPIS